MCNTLATQLPTHMHYDTRQQEYKGAYGHKRCTAHTSTTALQAVSAPSHAATLTGGHLSAA